MPWALTLALERDGRSIAAKMAIMAITTRSSISVKAWETGFLLRFREVANCIVAVLKINAD
jgi:hypothetical protein